MLIAHFLTPAHQTTQRCGRYAVSRPAVVRRNALAATVRMVVARGLTLDVLAALAFMFALSWAAKLLVSLLLGIVIPYRLNPLVAAMNHLSLGVAAAITVASIAGFTPPVRPSITTRGRPPGRSSR